MAKKNPPTDLSPTIEMTHPDGYESLAAVLCSAMRQASVGKGKARHAGELPYHLQPMQVVAEMLGTVDGIMFQAIKKIRESKRLPPDRAVAELLGAINYIAGAVIYIDKHGLPNNETENN